MHNGRKDLPMREWIGPVVPLRTPPTGNCAIEDLSIHSHFQRMHLIQQTADISILVSLQYPNVYYILAVKRKIMPHSESAARPQRISSPNSAHPA